MTQTEQFPQSPHAPPPFQPPEKRHRVLLSIGVVIAAGALIGIGAAIGGSGSHTTVKTVAGPVVTKTVNVPGPVTTKTVIKTVKVPVPGPTKTVTRTVQAPPPPAGAVISTFTGTGTQVTPSFNVPSSGDYIVKWSYSGNLDTSLGDSQPTNFSISETGSGFGDLPNDIAASGSGSTEVTGADATDSLNVQAAGSWTVTVIAA